MALRPTLDDGSSDDSSCDSSSDSSSDDDGVAAANSAAVGQDKHEASFTTHSDTSSALPNQTEALHHQWFWSAFISVQRLPGVRFCLSPLHNESTLCLHSHRRALCRFFPDSKLLLPLARNSFALVVMHHGQVPLRRLSRGPPKRRRRDGCTDSCIAARFLACDELEQANRLAILAVPFAHVLADVHRRKVQGSDAWLNWDWFIRWQHDKAQANISYSTVTSDALIRALPDWLPPCDWIGWRCGDRLPSLLHGDATCDNGMITWQHSASAAAAAAALTPASHATSECAPLISLIDFADCRIGPALYDFVAAWLSGLCCSPMAIKSFRASYSSVTGYDPLAEAFTFASQHPFCDSAGTRRCIASQAELFVCFCLLHSGARGALTALEASGCASIGLGRNWDEVVAHVALLLV